MLFLLSGCSGPQSTLDPAGPSALLVARLWWAMCAYSLLVLLVIALLWIYALHRRPKQFSDVQRRKINTRWIIGGGVILPTVSIGLLLAFGIPIGHRMLPLPRPEDAPLRIDVTGQQWWWEIHYPDAGITVVNELHVPIGRPVDVHVTSADVIHSFWAPKLGGKIDAIPGRINVRRLQADRPGRSRGQCAEFCGLRHAHMLLNVTAHEPEAYAEWLAGQQQSAAITTTVPGHDKNSEHQAGSSGNE